MGSDGETGATREEFVPDSIERMMRERIRETIEGLVAAELEAALGAAKLARVDTPHTGYCHSIRSGALASSLGPITFTLPRSRNFSDGSICHRAERMTPRRSATRPTRPRQIWEGSHES